MNLPHPVTLLALSGNTILLIDEAMAKFNICGYFRKRKYPQTGDGRKRYIQDSLSPIRKKKLICGLLFIALVILLLVFILCSLLIAP